VNKKKQKNFVSWSAPPIVGGFQVNKSFLLLFIKKDASCLGRRRPPNSKSGYFPNLLRERAVGYGVKLNQPTPRNKGDHGDG